ncbi:MAG: class I SAM-dependent methyltransferase [Deltaproteobacteria bacterium]|nr:class I SAM-dependent methyltransferase [Deltaproteobacteria bacterium]
MESNQGSEKQSHEINTTPSDWDRYFSSTKIDHSIMGIWAEHFVYSYHKYYGFSKSDVVLDFGAGLGDISFLVKDRVARIFLYDKSEYFLGQLGRKFASFPHIRVARSLLDVQGPVSLIIINSVIHYMTKSELEEMLRALRDLCDSKTRIIISDIVPPGYSKLLDALSQLRTGLRKKFLKKLLWFILVNLRENPKQSLSSSSFHLYGERDFKQILSRFGYTARKTEKNFSFSNYRYTLECRLKD